MCKSILSTEIPAAVVCSKTYKLTYLTLPRVSIIGIGCIGVGAYAALRNDSQQREVGQNKIQNRRLIR